MCNLMTPTFWPPRFLLVTCAQWPAAELRSVLPWHRSGHLECIQHVCRCWNIVNLKESMRKMYATSPKLTEFSYDYGDCCVIYRFLTSSIAKWSYPTDRVLITFRFGPEIRDTFLKKMVSLIWHHFLVSWLSNLIKCIRNVQIFYWLGNCNSVYQWFIH